MEDGILHASTALADALARGDAPAAAALYLDDGRLLTPTAEVITGRREIEAYWREGIAFGLSGVDLDVVELRVAADVAIEIGRYVLALDSRPAERGKYLVLHRRLGDGSWRRAVDVFNPDLQEER